jgi:hypothetical protein
LRQYLVPFPWQRRNDGNAKKVMVDPNVRPGGGPQPVW